MPASPDELFRGAIEHQLVNQVDNLAKSGPLVNEVDNLAKSPTAEETNSQSQIQTQPQVPDPKQPQVSSYNTIRQQAEQTKREELAGTNRKTKEAEIERAGIEAMMKQHAQDVGPDSDAITFRTNRFGRTSISGRELDPSNPAHDYLLQQANLSPEDIGTMNFLEQNRGKVVSGDHLSAPEKEAVTGVSRKAEQAESTAQDRIEGSAPIRRVAKTFVPTGFTYNIPSKTFETNALSIDKLLNNAGAISVDGGKTNGLIDWAKGQGMKVWSGINDPEFPVDFNKYIENQKNGYTSSGKPIEGTEATPVRPNPDYTPHVIPKDKADLLNAMMGDTSAKNATRKQGESAAASKADKQILAKQNSPYYDPRTGETNRVRAMLGDEAKRLESVYETMRPENLEHLREGPTQDEQTLRASGFEGDKSAFAEQDLPKSHFTASGFMPATPKHLEPIARELGLRYDGPSLGGTAHQFTDQKIGSSLDIQKDATPEMVKTLFQTSRDKFKNMPQFMPSTKLGAIDKAAVRLPDGQIFSDWMHPIAFAEGVAHYPVSKLAEWIREKGQDDYVESGFVDNQGNFLSRDEAEQRAKDVGQITERGIEKARKAYGNLRGGHGLEALNFQTARQFHLGGVVVPNKRGLKRAQVAAA